MNYSESVYRQRSIALITAMVGERLADVWWTGPNRAFDNRTPNEQWELDYTVVYNYLMSHANGDYS